MFCIRLAFDVLTLLEFVLLIASVLSTGLGSDCKNVRAFMYNMFLVTLEK